MYERHSWLEKHYPINPNQKIWRYMDFTKFVGILESRSLFFCRSDKFEDPYEGTLPDLTWSQRIESAKKMAPEGIPPEFDDKKYIESWVNSYRRDRASTLINCWHINADESDAMWKVYVNNSEGVAIQSTFSSLASSFHLTEPTVYIGEVHYIDYKTTPIPEGNPFYKFLHKQKSFEHEHELRAIVLRHLVNDRFFPSPIEFGVEIPVDLERLIHTIFVAPTAPHWFYKLVCSITNRYGVNVDVIQSLLYSKPIFS
jgi:hypothetical protein